jgi:hypothetical protein
MARPKLRGLRDALAATLATAVVLAPSSAEAQDPGSIPPSGIDGPTGARDLQLAAGRPYWSGGKSRLFVSSTMEGGLAYYRPQLALGYGKPHWRWFGAETQSRVSIGSGSTYAGLRAALPNADIRVGSRYVFAANQSYLLRAPPYTDDTIDFDDQPNARYVSLEAEINGSLPVGDGALFGTLAGFHMSGVPDAYDVFDQMLFVVVEPPWVARIRGGYVHGLAGGILQLGAAVETIAIPERDMLVVRAGPQLAVALTHHLDAAVSIMAVVASRDSLRLDGAEIGQFGFRYRWATGDPFPEFQ